MTGRKDLRVLG